MNKKVISSFGIVAVVVIAGAGVYASRERLFPKTATQASQSNARGADTTSTTYQRYVAMEGETYDRNFVSNMIAHHQGAVDMAKLAQKNAKHQELKDMADGIVAAQEKEIADMTSWQEQWGYPSSSSDNMMDHSAMGMMDDMANMTAELDGKTGDEFDKAFIEQMTAHHQSAIDMATPGEKNAKHREVKELAKAIIAAQSREISQMKQWQKYWGYSQS